jgi:hypothetical protein
MEYEEKKFLSKKTYNKLLGCVVTIKEEINHLHHMLKNLVFEEEEPRDLT